MSGECERARGSGVKWWSSTYTKTRVVNRGMQGDPEKNSGVKTVRPSDRCSKMNTLFGLREKIDVSGRVLGTAKHTTYGILQPCDEVIAVLLLLQTCERHLGARDVLLRTHTISMPDVNEDEEMTHLFGVFQVLEESVLVPCNALVDVGGSVREALDLTGLASKEPA